MIELDEQRPVAKPSARRSRRAADGRHGDTHDGNRTRAQGRPTTTTPQKVAQRAGLLGPEGEAMKRKTTRHLRAVPLGAALNHPIDPRKLCTSSHAFKAAMKTAVVQASPFVHAALTHSLSLGRGKKGESTAQLPIRSRSVNRPFLPSMLPPD